MTLEIPQQNKITVCVIDDVNVLIREETQSGEESSVLIHRDNVLRFCDMVKRCAELTKKAEA